MSAASRERERNLAVKLGRTRLYGETRIIGGVQVDRGEELLKPDKPSEDVRGKSHPKSFAAIMALMALGEIERKHD